MEAGDMDLGRAMFLVGFSNAVGDTFQGRRRNLNSGSDYTVLMESNIVPVVLQFVNSYLEIVEDELRVSWLWWKFPRQATLWKSLHTYAWKLLGEEILDREWRVQCRMSFKSFEILVEEFRPFCQFTSLRELVPLEQAVAAVLHRLGYGTASKIVGSLYGLGTSTVIKYTQLLTEILSNPAKLLNKYISWPDAHRQRLISNAFLERSGIPNMVGCIDGSHIRFARQPDKDMEPAAYWNRHDMHSVVLQGTCDHEQRWIDVSCLCPGGQHDSTSLRLSSLWKRLVSGHVLKDPVISIRSKPVRPYLFGDKAYPLMPFLMKGFDGGCSANKKIFNRSCARSRVVVENAFATLKNKFRILKCLNVGLEHSAQTIVACCVLHNFCLVRGEAPVNDSSPDPFLLAHSGNYILSGSEETHLSDLGDDQRDNLYEFWKARVRSGRFEPPLPIP